MKKLNLFLRNIKKGFATNSSSYHSTLMMSEEEYEKWKDGEIEVNGWSYEEYEETSYETDFDTYTTPGGEKIITISIFGYDG